MVFDITCGTSRTLKHLIMRNDLAYYFCICSDVVAFSSSVKFCCQPQKKKIHTSSSSCNQSTDNLPKTFSSLAILRQIKNRKNCILEGSMTMPMLICLIRPRKFNFNLIIFRKGFYFLFQIFF